jgi:hypothetical protein
VLNVIAVGHVVTVPISLIVWALAGVSSLAFGTAAAMPSPTLLPGSSGGVLPTANN